MNMNELIEDIIALKGVKTKCLNNNLQMTCWLDKKLNIFYEFWWYDDKI